MKSIRERILVYTVMSFTSGIMGFHTGLSVFGNIDMDEIFHMICILISVFYMSIIVLVYEIQRKNFKQNKNNLNQNNHESKI